MSSEIEKRMPDEQHGALEVRQQVNQIQHLMKEVLRDGEHFGTIKGCGNKPTLLQSGAEKIAYMFHFVPSYVIERADLGDGHREYEVRCTLTSRDTGQVMGGGLGTCSTMESKYRYRWEGYGNNRKKVENPDIADVWNTVLKMAKKRAFVDAVKSTTAASDIFTQDIEDLPEYLEPAPQATTAAPAAPAPSQAAPDPRKALWDECAALKNSAKELGATDDEINDWMACNIVNDDGASKAMNHYTADDIRLLTNYLQGLEGILKEPPDLSEGPEYETPPEPQDIEF